MCGRPHRSRAATQPRSVAASPREAATDAAAAAADAAVADVKIEGSAHRDGASCAAQQPHPVVRGNRVSAEGAVAARASRRQASSAAQPCSVTASRPQAAADAAAAVADAEAADVSTEGSACRGGASCAAQQAHPVAPGGRVSAEGAVAASAPVGRPAPLQPTRSYRCSSSALLSLALPLLPLLPAALRGRAAAPQRRSWPRGVLLPVPLPLPPSAALCRDR